VWNCVYRGGSEGIRGRCVVGVACTIKKLDEIVARLRKVTLYDKLLPEDHNDLVEAVKCVRDLLLTNPLESYVYWLTFFESLDGYFVSNATLDGTNLSLLTPAVTDSEAYVYNSRIPPVPALPISWDKEARIRTRFRILAPSHVKVYHFLTRGVAYPPTPTSKHFGFMIHDAKIYGTVGNDVVQTTKLLTYFAGGTRMVEARFYPADRVDFYIEGNLMGSITENLPSGDDTEITLVNLYVRTLEDVAKRLEVTAWEFWQAR